MGIPTIERLPNLKAIWSFSEKLFSYQLTLERTAESLRDEDCFSKSKKADSR